MDKKAMIVDIQKMSTEDGPGIRTTVFFKGCSLRCAWCHNPEGISSQIQIQWLKNRCIGCLSCSKACRNGALKFEESKISIDRERCKSCLSCVNICPTGALEAKGRLWDMNNLLREVLKDRAYYEKSGGGVTASGGEALLQSEFIEPFFKALKEEKIHTALDTAGNAGFDCIERVLPYTDLVLYDIKMVDTELHKKFTGSGNERILKNLLRIADYIRKNNRPAIWIRTPVIPGATDSEETIGAIGRFIRDNLNGVVSRWDLCAFNNLCLDKYKRLNMVWPYSDVPLMKKSQMEHLKDAAQKTGVGMDIVHWSGMTAIEEEEG